jgi:heme A synthase
MNKIRDNFSEMVADIKEHPIIGIVILVVIILIISGIFTILPNSELFIWTFIKGVLAVITFLVVCLIVFLVFVAASKSK